MEQGVNLFRTSNGGPACAVPSSSVVARSKAASANNRGNTIMTKLLQTLKASKSGASAAEYALIISLIGLVIVVGATALGSAVNTNFSTAATQINTP